MAKTRTTEADDATKAPPPDPETATAAGNGSNGAASPNETTALAAHGEGDASVLSDFITDDDKTEAPADDFDSLESFALPQAFDPSVEEEDPPVGVRKPGPMDFFRVHPDPAMSCNVGIIELRDERDDPYLVKPNMYPVFGKLVSRRRIFVCKNMQGIVSLWPAKLSEDGRQRNMYNETALKAAERAKSKWTRMQADTALKAYRIFGPGEEFPEPTWPDASLLDLMRKAFGDGYLIKDLDHPLVRRIRGLTK
jgi:hypothetical protein